MNSNIARENVVSNFTHSLDGRRILKQLEVASMNGRVETSVSPNVGACKLAFQALSMLGYSLQIVPIIAENRFDIIASWGVEAPFYNTDEENVGLL